MLSTDKRTLLFECLNMSMAWAMVSVTNIVLYKGWKMIKRIKHIMKIIEPVYLRRHIRAQKSVIYKLWTVLELL